MIVRPRRVRAGGDEREVADAHAVVALEDVVGDRFDLVFVHPGLGRTHSFEDPEACQARRFANDRDLGGALHEAQPIEDRIEIHDFRTRRDQFDLVPEHLFLRRAAVPRILLGSALEGAHAIGRDRANRLLPERHVDRPAFGGERLHDSVERRAFHDLLDAGHLPGFFIGSEQRPFGVFEARVRRQEQGGRLGAAVDEQNRPRHFDTAEVEELLVLLELLVVGPVVRPGHDRHAVADAVHDGGPVRRKLRRGVGVGKERLVRGDRRDDADGRQHGGHAESSHVHTNSCERRRWGYDQSFSTAPGLMPAPASARSPDDGMMRPSVPTSRSRWASEQCPMSAI